MMYEKSPALLGPDQMAGQSKPWMTLLRNYRPVLISPASYVTEQKLCRPVPTRMMSGNRLDRPLYHAQTANRPNLTGRTKMIEERNATIKSARISNDDHGLLSAWIDLDYGGSGQGFGGYSLYLPDSFKNHGGPNYAGHFIWRVMEVAGVSEWGRLSGKTIRVQCDHSKIHAIGHIINDDWFNPGEDFRAMEASSDNGETK